MLPSLSALRSTHSTASKRARQRLHLPALLVEQLVYRPAGTVVVHVRDRVAPRRQMPRRLSVALRVGLGAMRLRRRKPTAFSTDPFSLPEYGLQDLVSSR